MGRKKAHRAYAGGRRRFFRRLMRKYYTPGDFDPSVFSPPRLSPLPEPGEIQEALGIQEPDDPFLIKAEGPLTNKISETPAILEPPAFMRDPPDRSQQILRRKPAKASSDFVPSRKPTRPLPPPATARKPTNINEKIIPANPRKLPTVTSNIRPNFELQRTPLGYIAIMYE